ncbi:MAG: XRE family transcriptional regulator [Bacteriovoracia bacterium]
MQSYIELMAKPREVNPAFLIALGAHCRKIRMQRGYSIDRLSKESGVLSASVIHRLESGKRPVSISSIERFAEVLGLHPKDLLDFEYSTENKILPIDHPDLKKKKFVNYFPLYTLKAAAGYFGKAEEVDPEGWIEVSGLKADQNMFVVRAVGHSMEPKIKDGDFVVFRANPSGSRQGKIVLVQYRGPADPETGGSYTVKKYSSTKIQSQGEWSEEWRHEQITLSPINKEYRPIVLTPRNEDDCRVIAEFVRVV